VTWTFVVDGGVDTVIAGLAPPDGAGDALCISQGTAPCRHVHHQHPERVARMILYGGLRRDSAPRRASLGARYRDGQLQRLGRGERQP